jgi:hypothetical protein
MGPFPVSLSISVCVYALDVCDVMLSARTQDGDCYQSLCELVCISVVCVCVCGI